MMYTKVRKIVSVLALFAPLAFGSCFGFDAEIEPGENGTVLNLEYRVSSRFEDTGKLDGNEQWPIFPAGKRDFERTAARLKGTRLKSFSSKNRGDDLVTRVSLEFDDMETLVSFLDAAGEDVSYKTENGKNVLSMTLHRQGGASSGGAEYRSFVTAAFEGYAAAISLKSPGAAVVSLGGGGNRIDIPGAAVAGGGRASFSMPMGDLLSFDGPVTLEFTW
ncbi:MAG: hypothetical protein LBI86_05600 [Treponema sp.]|jgi:hypothetical protein|nr:hypothetical protein [Treponema sp.]